MILKDFSLSSTNSVCVISLKSFLHRVQIVPVRHNILNIKSPQTTVAVIFPVYQPWPSTSFDGQFEFLRERERVHALLS